MATRSLIGAGTGQYFASSFSLESRAAIQKIAKDIYDDLFVPSLETPIKTLDLPVAGRSYSFDTVSLILDVVEFVNKPNGDSVKLRKKTDRDILAPTMEKDADGSQALSFLKSFRRISSRIAGTTPDSLGLHPAVYFYSATGRYQPTAFLAAINLVNDLVASGRLNEFSSVRQRFEDLLLKHKYFINQIARKYGSGQRGLTSLTRLYSYMLKAVVDRKSDEEIFPLPLEDQYLSFLTPIIDYDKGIKKEFTRELKSAIFLKTALDSAIRCGICSARIHRNSVTFDHIQEKRSGGLGSEANGQVAHPYCNSTFKDWLRDQNAD